MSGANWRDSSRGARFFVVDAYAAFPLLLFLVHIKAWTFYLAIATMIFFGILEKFKFSIPVFFRWTRSTLAGRIRVAHAAWRE